MLIHKEPDSQLSPAEREIVKQALVKVLIERLRSSRANKADIRRVRKPCDAFSTGPLSKRGTPDPQSLEPVVQIERRALPGLFRTFEVTSGDARGAAALAIDEFPPLLTECVPLFRIPAHSKVYSQKAIDLRIGSRVYNARHEY